MWIGAYSLVLYCDNVGGANTFTEYVDGYTQDIIGHRWGEFPHEYVGELGTTRRSAARKDGWIIRKDGTASCPCCNKKSKQKEL